MFIIGLELQRERLWALRRSIFGISALHLLVCGAALAALAWWANLRPAGALIVGIALAMTSRRVRTAGARRARRMDSPRSRNLLGAAVSGPERDPGAGAGGCARCRRRWRQTQAIGWPALAAVVGVVLLGRPFAVADVQVCAEVQFARSSPLPRCSPPSASPG